MTEFTEEQETEIQKRIDEATKYEQWRVAYAQAYRIVMPYLESLVDQYDPQTKKLVRRGSLDPFVFAVFETECNKVLEEYFPPKQNAEQKP